MIHQAEKKLRRECSALLKVKLTGTDQGDLLMLWGVSDGMTILAMM
jgi:hypothetical protein